MDMPAASRRSLPEDRPLLLFAGFVRPYKGLDILLEALAQVNRPLHLLVAGEFWKGVDAYRSQIDRLGLRDSWTILDRYLPDEMIANVMKRADVVVLPYRRATQSGVVQVAFGHNKPVITTDVGGLGDVVTHGVTGLLVPPNDPAAFAGAIERYFSRNLGPVLAKNIARDRDRFSWKHLVACLEQLARR